MTEESTRLLPAVPGQSLNCYDAGDESNATMVEKSIQSSKKLNQYVAAIAVTMGAVSAGTVLAWTAPITNALKDKSFYDFSISEDELGWIGSLVPLGALIMCLLIGPVCDFIGRKLGMLMLVVPFIIGWSLIIWAQNIEMIYAGRFITGMAGGAFCVSAPLYISEIADFEIKGTLGSYFQLLLVVGIFMNYLVGWLAAPLTYTIICAVPPLVFVVAFALQPETPIYLLKKGKTEAAHKSLTYFRGETYNVDAELESMQESLVRDRNGKGSLLAELKKKEVVKGLIIIYGLMFFQQLSGINAVIFYTSEIFLAANVSDDPELPAKATILVGAMQVIATFAASFLIEKLGRKKLLLISDGVMTVCALLLGIFFTLKDRQVISSASVTDIGFLPILSLCVFIIVFSLGFGPIPWMIASELFSPQVKSLAGSTAGTFNWFLAFLVTKFFLNVKSEIGGDSTFYIFAGLSLLGTLFVLFVVPETKGKTVADVQAELRGETGVPHGDGMGVDNPGLQL